VVFSPQKYHPLQYISGKFMVRRIVKIALIFLLLCITLVASDGKSAQKALRPNTPTPIPATPTPVPTPSPVLTVRGTPPALQAKASYLVDTDTGNVLENVNGTQPLPMASTTKIMTALIAIQTANLNQPITVTQDELNQVPADASSAGLIAGDTLSLKDLLYGLMLQSGDDAALVIADALAGTTAKFVQRMNLFAYRFHLFQTHYTNPHGLNPASDQEHYTTAANLTSLSEYAMHLPIFAQIVQTTSYQIAPTSQHHSYTWTNTNTMLASYQGMIGIKTGHTDAAGWCLVFAATRNGHHLMGAVLNSPTEAQRNQDVTTLLNWGFSLPMLPPTV
jgi:D-alanyl-D-alanine carboxypeptidase (penicillin-binding protein 5/6)